MIDLLAQAAAQVPQAVIPAAPVYPVIPNALELSGRLVLAAVLGAVVGLERELNDHPSGLRTHITVALGSALFAVCSAYAFQDFVALRTDNNYSLDPTRIAAQIVSGVGFLGAGAIIKQGNTVRGLTSAAGLWVSAAIGMAVAFGMYLEAVITTLTLTILLVLLKRPRSWLRHRARMVRETIVITLAPEADPSRVITAIGGLADTLIKAMDLDRDDEDDVTIIKVELEAKAGVLERRLAKIEARDDVTSVDFD